MQTALKWIGIVVKVLSLAVGLSSYTNLIPAKWLPVAVIVFGVASVLKDAAIHLGDLLDDGVQNNSFKY